MIKYSLKALRVIVTLLIIGGGLGGVAKAESETHSHASKKMVTDHYVANLIQRVLPAVVSLRVASGRTSNQQVNTLEDWLRELLRRQGTQRPSSPNKQEGQKNEEPIYDRGGSGFVISADGLVVTNNHVIDGSKAVEVDFNDGRTFKAVLVGTDPRTDLALLKIQSDHVKFPTVEFGDSQELRIGERVLAVGNPLGIGGTVTSGIVSNVRHDFSTGNGTGYPVTFETVIQTDAAINRGNSGGPLFDMNGQVVGINTFIASNTGGSVGLNFAVASQVAIPIIEQLRKNGKVERGWLGVRIQPVTKDIATELNFRYKSENKEGRDNHAPGALISEVISGSPAEKADLQAGDIIVSFKEKTVKNVLALPRLVAGESVASVVPLTLWRRGRSIKKRVVLAPFPDDLDKKTKKESSFFLEGLQLLSLKNARERFYDIPGRISDGLLIEKIAPNSFAQRVGLRPGMIILEASRKSVTTVKQFEKIVASVRARSKQSLLLLIWTGRGKRFLSLPLLGGN